MFTAISVHFTKSTTICLSRFLTIAIQHALITSVPFIYMSIDVHSNHHSFAHGNSLYCFIQLTLEFLLLTDIFNLWHWQHSASPLKFLGSNSWFCLQPVCLQSDLQSLVNVTGAKSVECYFRIFQALNLWITKDTSGIIFDSIFYNRLCIFQQLLWELAMWIP